MLRSLNFILLFSVIVCVVSLLLGLYMNSTLPRLNNLLRHFVSSSSGEMATFTLNTGATIPKIGLGTWKSQKGEVKGAVLEALKSGYKLIDCAVSKTSYTSY